MVNRIVKYQCNRCGKIYDQKSEADVCERTEVNDKLYPTATNIGKCIVCGKKITGHVLRGGDRYHVIRWDTNGTHCSNKECYINHGEGKCQTNL
jgi:hypothetical protein